MTRLYSRRVAVTVGDLRFTGETTDRGVRIPGFHISFSVQKTNESTANKANVAIANLREDSRSRIAESVGKQFVIEAGYRDAFGEIFRGKVGEASSQVETTGSVTKIEAQDGQREMKNRTNISLPEGANLGQAVERIVRDLKLSAGKSLARAKQGDFDGAVKTFYNGITMSGEIKDELDKLSRTHGFDWSIQDETLQMLKPAEATDEPSVLLHPESGLVGSPERIFDKKRPKLFLVRARSLIQSEIRINRRIVITSAAVTGVFKVLKIDHSGDTKSGDWITELEAVAL